MPVEASFRWSSGGVEGLRAPAPPPSAPIEERRAGHALSFSSSSHAHNDNRNAARRPAARSSAPPPQPAPAVFTLSDPSSATTAAAADRRRHSTQSYFRALPEMVLCCCCCPIYKCVLWACAFELVVSVYCWYRMLGVVLSTINHLETKDGIILFVLTFWIVTLITATSLIIASHRRKNASYVLPRLIQQAGLLLVGVLTALALTFYFFGNSSTINSYIMMLYKMFTGLKIEDDDERELKSDIRTAALICIPIVMICVPYIATGLWTTRRYYNKLKTKYGDGFQPVEQSELAAASAPPQPPVNPNFKA